MKNKPATRACFGLERLPVVAVPAMAMPAPVTAMMPSTVPPVMMTPAHFGRELPRIVLHCTRRTRIDQRHRARTLDRRGHYQNRGDRRESQNFHPVHLAPLFTNHASVVRLCTVSPRRRWIRKVSAVNAD